MFEKLKKIIQIEESLEEIYKSSEEIHDYYSNHEQVQSDFLITSGLYRMRHKFIVNSIITCICMIISTILSCVFFDQITSIFHIQNNLIDGILITLIVLILNGIVFAILQKLNSV